MLWLSLVRLIFSNNIKNLPKVIIQKSSGEVFLVEQPTIDFLPTAYLEFIIESKKSFLHLHFMQLFSADATIFNLFFCPQNIEKLSSKVANK